MVLGELSFLRGSGEHGSTVESPYVIHHTGGMAARQECLRLQAGQTCAGMAQGPSRNAIPSSLTNLPIPDISILQLILKVCDL